MIRIIDEQIKYLIHYIFIDFFNNKKISLFFVNIERIQ